MLPARAQNKTFLLHLEFMLKAKPLFYVFALLIIGCNGQPQKPVEQPTVHKATTDNIKLHPLNKLFTVGDFDGDGKQDTLLQHNYSALTKSEIEYAPDPFQNEWDTVVEWFYKQEALVYLTLKKTMQTPYY